MAEAIPATLDEALGVTPAPAVAPAPTEDLDSKYRTQVQDQEHQEAVRELGGAPGDTEPEPVKPAEPYKPQSKGSMVLQGVWEAVNPLSNPGAKIQGVAEIPRALAKGGRDATQAIVDTWIEFGNGAEKLFTGKVAEGRVQPGELQLPDIDEPNTDAGKLTASIAKFTFGFYAGMKALGAAKARVGAGAATSFAGKATETAVGGGVGAGLLATEFQENTANLLNDLLVAQPGLKAPVLEYLAADPEDGAALRRLKAAVVGSGESLVADGVLKVFLTGIKGFSQMRRAVADMPPGEGGVPGGENPHPLSPLGDPNADLIVEKDLAGKVIKPKADIEAPDVGVVAKKLTPEEAANFSEEELAKAMDETSATTPGEAIYGRTGIPASIEINFARIDSPEDVKDVLKQMADMHASDIDVAKRGVRSWDTTKLSAEQEDAWKLIQERTPAGAWNAEQSLAARQLWVSSAKKLHEISRLAVEAPTEANLVAFRKMLATHYTVQTEVLAARTETARALNAWRIPAGARGDMTKQLQSLLEQNGGEATTKELAKRVAALAETGMARELEEVVSKGWAANSASAVKQVWINALLTAPGTHVTNFASGYMTAFMAITERRVGSALRQLAGADEGVVDGEAFAMMDALVTGQREALRAAAKMAKLGESEFGQNLKADTPRGPGALSAETWGANKDTPMAMFLNFADAATSLPTRALATTDEYMKSIAYRTELSARALRQATQEAHAGTIPNTTKDIAKRKAEIQENPPEDLQLDAVDAALYRTFTQRAATKPADLARAWHNLPFIGPLTLPFRNTPINIMTYTMERTPFAPLVKQWRDDIAAGGARGQLAAAKIATGTAIMSVAYDLALRGEITGRGPQRAGESQALAREGRQPYSIKVGNKWVSYGRVDPPGGILGLAADMAEISRNGDVSPGDMEQLFTASVLATANAVTSKTFFVGIADLVEAIGDRERYGEGYIRKLVSGAVVPPGVAAVARIQDPYLRASQDISDAVCRRTPGCGKDMPALLDLWGRKTDFRSGFGSTFDLLSPVYVKTANPEPIDIEMDRLELYPQRPEKTLYVRGVKLDLSENPQAYWRYVELAGNEYKHLAWGKGAKDALNDLVTGKHSLSPVYEEVKSDQGKQNMIKDFIRQYRDGATKQLLKEFPDLQLEVDRNWKPGGGNLNPRLLGEPSADQQLIQQ